MGVMLEMDNWIVKVMLWDFVKDFLVEKLKSDKQYNYECNISDIFRDFKCCDVWGCASLTLGSIGVEYNLCVEDGDDYSGIYKMVRDEDADIFETDPTVFVPYTIDLNNPEWKADLEDSLCVALIDFHLKETE